jgi:hypothetical protein
VHPVRIVIAALVVVVLVVLIFATGWSDDRAMPGTSGRGTVTRQR